MNSSLLSVLALIFSLTQSNTNSSRPFPWIESPDSRLDQKISFTSSGMTIGAFLEKLTAVAGVRLRAQETDGATDVRIATFIIDQPLTDILAALHSLVSYRNAEWRWRRDQEHGQAAYVLSRPDQAQRAGQRFRQWLHERLKFHSSQLIAISDMTLEERRNSRQRINAAMFGTIPSRMDELISRDDDWDSIHLFGSALSEADRQSVLSGAQSPKIAVSNLTKRGKNFILTLWRGVADRAVAAGRIPPDQPEWIRFSLEKMSPGPAMVVNLHIDKLGGSGFIGVAVANEYIRHLKAEWLSPLDTLVHRTIGSRIVEPDVNAENESKDTGAPLARRLAQLSRGSKTSILARVHFAKQKDSGSPANNSVEQYVNSLAKADVIAKWRSNVLLIDSVTWPQDELSILSQAYRHRLREIAGRNGGFLPLATLSEIAATLGTQQLLGLSTDFPVTMNHVVLWKALLRLCHAHPGMVSAMRNSAGAPLNEEMIAVLSENRTFGQFPLNESIRLHLQEQSFHDQAQPTRAVSFILKTFSGRFVAGLGFEMPQMTQIEPQK